MKFITISLIFFSAFSLSCSKSERMINGEVFVVTQGAGNIKLGLVNVSAYSDKDMKAHIASVKEDLSSDLSNAENAYSRCSKGSSNCMREYLVAIQDVQNRIIHLSAPPISSATTNADGKFQLNVPDNEVIFVVAKAQRKIANETEYYFWFRRISSDGTPSEKSQPLLLSNDSLMSKKSIETLLANY